MILIIDNYDSFTFNLYQYIGEICCDIKVVRNDEISVDDLKNMSIDGIIISPGPKEPKDAGICVEVIKEYGKSIPILGICLGHQAIGYAYGADIVRAKNIMHGKTSLVKHEKEGLFKGIKCPISVMRYHSLVIDKRSIPEELIVTCESDDGVVMGVKHRKYETYGLQFHPESILTECGMDIIKNFLVEVCHVKGGN